MERICRLVRLIAEMPKYSGRVKLNCRFSVVNSAVSFFCFVFVNALVPERSIIDGAKATIKVDDEFVKRRIHHVFGVWCFVFGTIYWSSYPVVRSLNTKHQILNTLVKRLVFQTFYETINIVKNT